MGTRKLEASSLTVIGLTARYDECVFHYRMTAWKPDRGSIHFCDNSDLYECRACKNGFESSIPPEKGDTFALSQSLPNASTVRSQFKKQPSEVSEKTLNKQDFDTTCSKKLIHRF